METELSKSCCKRAIRLTAGSVTNCGRVQVRRGSVLYCMECGGVSDPNPGTEVVIGATKYVARGNNKLMPRNQSRCQ
jgi:hypothetical protein